MRKKAKYHIITYLDRVLSSQQLVPLFHTSTHIPIWTNIGVSIRLIGAIPNPRHVKPQTHQTPDKHNQDLSNQRHTKPKLRHNVTALEAHRVLGLGV